MKRPTLGGVWCEQNLYEGLKTNNLLSTYEFSDWHMDPKKYYVKPGKIIPVKVIFLYLNDYARHFNIFDKIPFR
ncbi:UNVERIFIED_CONTAM: K+ transport protein, partial [Bacteroidetes bacterium 56_B9]